MNLFKRRKKIAVHCGSFHADDVFAVAALSLWLDQQGERYKIIRTRDKDTIDVADYVIDVGLEYDHDRQRYDHHQTEGAGRHSNGIPYASFGLIWKHYGFEISGNNCDVWSDINVSLVQPIDAGDNGVDVCLLNDYGVKPIIVQNILHWLTCDKDNDRAFKQAFAWARKILKNVLSEKVRAHRAIAAIIKEFEHSDDTALLVLEGDYSRQLIWQALMPKEEAKNLLYAVYSSGDDSSWNVVAMRSRLDSFDSRKPLPEEWRGLDEKDFQRVSGVADAIFCHRSGFLAAARSREGAVTLAKRAIEM
jgi:uncharacterized UPF0160 family protein